MFDQITRYGGRDDYYRRDRYVHVPRRKLRRRRGRVPHPLPDYARADIGARGGDGQPQVETLVAHAPRADHTAACRLLLHRRGEGPRSLVGPEPAGFLPW